jgi:hypothetical protein
VACARGNADIAFLLLKRGGVNVKQEDKVLKPFLLSSSSFFPCFVNIKKLLSGKFNFCLFIE